MGGEHYSHQGGGVNYLCLPNKPKYDRYSDSDQTAGYVYGTEYQVNDFDPFKNSVTTRPRLRCLLCHVTWFNADDAREE